jgi:four helix bundle protein
MGEQKNYSFDDWILTVPARLKSEPLWESVYYRLAMYMYDLVWEDCLLLKVDFRGREIVGQLVRSAGSVCANMEEAYGRGVGTADYIRIMRIALGEIREMQGWYYRSRHIISDELIGNRINIINSLIAAVVNTISHHRKNLNRS